MILNTPEYFSSVRTEIETILPDRLGSVLEIGCGTGATMAWLRTIRPVEYAVGVEIVPDVAAKARAAFDVIIVGSVESTPLSSNRKFDTVIALDVLEHLLDPWAVVQMLAGLLKSEGVMLASIPNVGHWKASFELFFRGRWDYQQDGILDRTHLRFFTEETARSLFERNGFRVEKIEYVKSYPGKTQGSRWRNRRLLSPILPARFTNFQFLIRARRLESASKDALSLVTD